MRDEGEAPAARENKGAWGWIHHQLRANVLNLSFWLGLTLGFPLEHFLWVHVWPFKVISKWLGLLD